MSLSAARKRELSLYAAILAGAVTIAVVVTALTFRSADRSASTAQPGGNASFPVDSAAPDRLLAFFIANDMTLGENRLSFALRFGDGTPVRDDASNVIATYNQPVFGGGPPITQRTITDLVFRPWPTGGGVYVGTVDFDEVGPWDFTVTRAAVPAGSPGAVADGAVFVKDVPSAPLIGDVPPPTPSKTADTIEGVKQIASWLPPGPDPGLYTISVDDAVASGKPVVVAFATPAYCTSFTCGPQVDVLTALRQRYDGRAYFIHVELFDNPAEMASSGDPGVGRDSPVVAPWNLPSEPWTFVIGSDGRIAARFDAFTTEEELAAALDLALAAQS